MILTSVGDGVVVLAPAKLNLFLEVLDRRADGFHEIETLMVAMAIFDTIYFLATREDRIRLTCETAAGTRARELSRGAASSLMGDIPASADNLVVRAVERLRDEAGVHAGAMIRLGQAHSVGGRPGWCLERCGRGTGGRQCRVETGLVP